VFRKALLTLGQITFFKKLETRRLVDYLCLVSLGAQAQNDVKETLIHINSALPSNTLVEVFYSALEKTFDLFVKGEQEESVPEGYFPFLLFFFSFLFFSFLFIKQ